MNSQERYEQMSRLSEPTPEGIALGNQILRKAGIILVAVVIVTGLVLGMSYSPH